jgi:hypothetical protein
MAFYPVPAIIAAFGFTYVLFARPNFTKEIRYGLIIIVAGIVIYMIRSFHRHEWPFAPKPFTPEAQA